MNLDSEQRRASSVSVPDRLLRAFGHLPVIPKGIRYRVVNLCRPTDEAPDRHFEVSFFGLSYKGTLACEIDRRVFFFGAFEPEILDLIGGMLAKMDSPIVADIGANVGHHSIYFSKFAKQVHSFEPWSKVSAQLDGHLRDNDIRNVCLHRVALGAEDESRIYYAPEGGNSGTGSFVATHARDRNQPSDPLPIVNGDRYLERNGIERLDLLKIDVEGWEWFVLLGLAKTIKRCRPVVLFEYSQSTSVSLLNRSQLTMFVDYKLFLVEKRLKEISGEAIPLGILLFVPREKCKLLPSGS